MITLPIAAQTQCGHHDDPISTDRTSITNSSAVVPCHSLQVESGIQVSSEAGTRGIDLPETFLRYGVSSKTELRLNVPEYFQSFPANGNFTTGLGDTGIGVKQSVAATANGFNLALLGQLTLPTGSVAGSSHGYDPTFQILPSQKLTANITAAAMFSATWPTVAGKRAPAGQSSLMFDWTARPPLDVFVEYSGNFGTGRPQHLVDTGALFRPTKRQQIDFRAGFGASPSALDHFYGVGYSIRFDL